MHHPTPRRALPTLAAAALFALFVPLTLPLAAAAQDDATAAAPAVARIDAISGDVAIQRGDDNETLAAVTNAPVLGADYVTTGQDGRAEIGFDGHSAVRLGESVQMRFTRIDPADRQMQLAAGTIELRLFGDTDGQSQIDTPSISVVPRTAGSFRVSVDENGTTVVTVRSGRADVVTPQGTQSLEPGTTLVADGPASSPSVQTQAALAMDAFDAYNTDRDTTYQVATSASQYVDTDIQGIGDLNNDGRWVDDSSYGAVWIPTDVAPGWAPYRDGSWVWEDSYGWTWVAAEPWGWAPYHYGRWYYSAGYHSWAWFPPRPARYAPAWSPALVGFVGFSIGAVNVGIGFGNIGWVPLAPYEAFHPWWGHNGATIVSNATYVNNGVNYQNLHVNGAMTSVTREDFQNGRFTHPTVPSQEQLRTLSTVPFRGALPIVPTQANLHDTQRAPSPALAAHSAPFNRTFAGTAMPAARTPFGEQQASFARTTSYQRSSDPWSRFTTNRSTSGQAYAQPAYERPALSSYSRPASPAYSRPAAPAYSPYSRPAASTYGQYSRPAAPTYTRSAAPAYSPYSRPAASTYGQYSRSAAPAYSRRAAPSYSRPAAPSSGRSSGSYAYPQARSTHGHG